MGTSVFMVAAMVLAAGDDAGKSATEVPVIATALMELSPAVHPKGVQLVVQSEAELAKVFPKDAHASATVAKALKVPAIDFSKQTLLVFSGSPEPGGILNVGLTKLTQQKGQLDVSWHITGRLTLATDPPQLHARVVLIEKVTGKVHFEKPEQQIR